MATDSKILARLDDIKSELTYIKEHLVDVDCVLTDEDVEALREADEALALGKTKRL